MASGFFARYSRIKNGNLINHDGKEIKKTHDYLLKPDGTVAFDKRGNWMPDFIESLDL